MDAANSVGTESSQGRVRVKRCRRAANRILAALVLSQAPEQSGDSTAYGGLSHRGHQAEKADGKLANDSRMGVKTRPRIPSIVRHL